MHFFFYFLFYHPPLFLHPFLHNHCRHIPINNLNTIALFETEFQSNVWVEHIELISPFTELTICVHLSRASGAEGAVFNLLYMGGVDIGVSCAHFECV